MSVDDLYKQLFFSAQEKEEAGNIVESISDYRKLECLLSGESLRCSDFSSFDQFIPLQTKLFQKIEELSQKLPLDGAIFKLASVVDDFKFSFHNLTNENISTMIQSSFMESESLNPASNSLSTHIPSNAPTVCFHYIL